MKKFFAFLLVFVMLLELVACSPQNTSTQVAETKTIASTEPTPMPSEAHPVFTGLNDPALLEYVENEAYSDVINLLDSDTYFVENVSAQYISNEYLNELAYNSQDNIYYGYSITELQEQFQGTKFVFTYGENGQTVVQEFEEYDDTYDKVIRNIAIGSGVILLCVTVSTATVGVAPAVSVIFAASAKSASIFALSSGVFGGAASGIVTGIQTKNFDEALKATALAGSEGFMWGAITGALSGGATEAIALKGATRNGLTMNQAAAIQRESKYPLDVIKSFNTVEQYEICKKSGLVAKTINGRTVLMREFDLNFTDELGRTNLQRMKEGLAALDPIGQPYELHHIGQKMDSPLAILTKEEHGQGGNYKIWNEIGKPSEIDRNLFKITRQDTWKSIAELM